MRENTTQLYIQCNSRFSFWFFVSFSQTWLFFFPLHPMPVVNIHRLASPNTQLWLKKIYIKQIEPMVFIISRFSKVIPVRCSPFKYYETSYLESEFDSHISMDSMVLCLIVFYSSTELKLRATYGVWWIMLNFKPWRFSLQ